MKAFFLYSIFILFSLSSFGQKIRFTDPTNFWRVQEEYTLGSSVSYYYYDFSYGNDTVVGGKTYKQFITTWSNPELVREDSAAGLVYYYNTYLGSEDTLYNYNLHLSDTIDYSVDGFYFRDRVTRADSLQINGIYHRRFDFTCVNCSQYFSIRHYSIIEGIGSISGPFFPAFATTCYGGASWYVYDLQCFSENNATPSFSIMNYYDCYGNGVSLTNTNTCWPTEVLNSTTQVDNWVVYPNPVRDYLTLETMSHVQGQSRFLENHIQVLDIVGKTVVERAMTEDKLDIDLGTLKAGVYFVQLCDKGGNKQIKKIIKE